MHFILCTLLFFMASCHRFDFNPIDTSLNRWYKAGWIHAFMSFMPNSDPIVRLSQQIWRVIRPGNKFSLWSSAVVAHLFQALAFGDALPHTSVIEISWDNLWVEVSEGYWSLSNPTPCPPFSVRVHFPGTYTWFWCCVPLLCSSGLCRTSCSSSTRMSSKWRYD